MMKSESNTNPQGVYQSTSHQEYVQHTGGASIGNNPFTSRAHNDTLLSGLTENQRAYVINHLYPSLREAIKQFAIEA
jgi:hypothetical protein